MWWYTMCIVLLLQHKEKNEFFFSSNCKRPHNQISIKRLQDRIVSVIFDINLSFLFISFLFVCIEKGRSGECKCIRTSIFLTIDESIGGLVCQQTWYRYDTSTYSFQTYTRYIQSKRNILFKLCALWLSHRFFSLRSSFFLRIDVKLTSDMTFIVVLFPVKSNKCSFPFIFFFCWPPIAPNSASTCFDVKSTTIKNEFKMIWHLSHCQRTYSLQRFYLCARIVELIVLIGWGGGRRANRGVGREGYMFRLLFIWYSVRKCDASLVFWVVVIVVSVTAAAVVVGVIVEHRDTCKLAICPFIERFLNTSSFLFHSIIFRFDGFSFCHRSTNECEGFILHLFFT